MEKKRILVVHDDRVTATGVAGQIAHAFPGVEVAGCLFPEAEKKMKAWHRENPDTPAVHAILVGQCGSEAKKLVEAVRANLDGSISGGSRIPILATADAPLKPGDGIARPEIAGVDMAFGASEDRNTIAALRVALEGGRDAFALSEELMEAPPDKRSIQRTPGRRDPRNPKELPLPGWTRGG